MLKRKLASAVLTGAMALSLAVPAFAAGNTATSGTQNTTLTGELASATIKLTVPETGKVILNPYHIKVDIAGTASDTEDDVTTGVVSLPLVIKSETNSALKVSAAVTGTVPTGVTLTSAPLAASDVEKKAFMYFEIVNCGVEDPSSDVASIKWATYDSTKVAANHLVVASTEQKKDDMIKIPDASEEAQYAAFHVTGDAVEAPTKKDTDGKTDVADPWKAADKIDVAVAFTFTPTGK